MLMLLGAACGLTGVVMSIAGHDAAILIFAGGALFGKGYGIWEERDG
jgi:hypothetical protein